MDGVMRRGRWGILAHKGRSLRARESNQRSSQRTTESKRDGLAGEADESGGRPRELGREGAGDIGAGVTGNEGEEVLPLGTNGAEGGDHKGNAAEAATRRRSRWGAEVVTRGLRGDVRVGAKAGEGGAIAGEGRRASNVRGLDGSEELA